MKMNAEDVFLRGEHYDTRSNAEWLKVINKVTTGSKRGPSSRPIICIDNGMEYESIKRASEIYNISKDRFSKHLNGHPGFITLNGYSFRWL